MKRLDQEILARNLTSSRARANRAIKEGHVWVNNQPARKASLLVNETDIIKINDPAAEWVSRAALKILPILEPHNNAVAIDLGASTGGFTQALLKRGARKVFAVDVGHDQLDIKIRNDPRVIVAEGYNVKNLALESFEDADWPNFDVITSDLSFISLRKALPATLALARPNVFIYALVKPQFELEPAKIGKGGIVKHQSDALDAVEEVKDWLIEQNWQILKLIPSPIKGGDGNQEYVIQAQKL